MRFCLKRHLCTFIFWMEQFIARPDENAVGFHFFCSMLLSSIKLCLDIIVLSASSLASFVLYIEQRCLSDQCGNLKLHKKPILDIERRKSEEARRSKHVESTQFLFLRKVHIFKDAFRDRKRNFYFILSIQFYVMKCRT